MNARFIGHVELPLQRVHLELTNLCQFNCLFCPKSEMTRSPGFMETDLARRLISDIKRHEISEKITFHVMGEPTLHPDFFDIIYHARDESVDVGLTTNGTELGREVGRRLAHYNLHQIDVSLQTPDEECFELRKAGKLSFNEYLSGILNFFADYRAHNGHQTRFKFRFLNTRFPKKSIEDKYGPVRVISSTAELRRSFQYWAGRIYDVIGVEPSVRERAFKQIDCLVAYKWNVVEIYPNVFFETYMIQDWAHAFEERSIRKAWAGYCFGMRDHFSVLYNGDVTLCCIDYDGQTAIGNVNDASLEEILSSDMLGEIISGFKKYRVVHPYCQICLGSPSLTSWLLKPLSSIITLKILKPFFYKQIRL